MELNKPDDAATLMSSISHLLKTMNEYKTFTVDSLLFEANQAVKITRLKIKRDANTGTGKMFTDFVRGHHV